MIASLLLLALFPNGRFVLRWTRWLVIGFMVIRGLVLFIPTSTLVSFLLGTWLFFGVALLLVFAQIYRRTYDAAKIVAAYSATLRREVELAQIREHLLAAVEETMQPTHVSLWLRTDEPGRTSHTAE